MQEPVEKFLGCKNKVAHVSEAKATEVAKKSSKHYNDLLLPYKCKFCAYWHVGHPSRRTK